MCTVTYVPHGEEIFTLTSNRDEAPSRSGTELVKKTINNREVLFPKDTSKGGTWIAISSEQQVLCLLNGAFVKHKHEPPYRRSRGLMVLDFFEYNSANAFFAEYDFVGMEPFTLVVWEKGQLWQLRWDEAALYVDALDPTEKHIWASATLYNEDLRKQREEWFEEWAIKNDTFDAGVIYDFHRNAGNGDVENDLVMNRNNIVQTVSITQINVIEEKASLKYRELETDSLLERSVQYPQLVK